MNISQLKSKIQTDYAASRGVISAKEAKEIIAEVKVSDLPETAIREIRDAFEGDFSAAGLRAFDAAAAQISDGNAPTISGASAMLRDFPTQLGTPGVKVAGLHTETPKLTINFEEAAANIANLEKFSMPYDDDPLYEIWEGRGIRLALSAFPEGTVAVNEDLPPYYVVMTGTEDGPERDMLSAHGWSGFDDGSATIIRAGSDERKFFPNGSARDAVPEFTLSLELDQTNDYEFPERPDTSSRSKKFKKGWNRFWKAGSFTLEGTSRKPLLTKTAEDMRELVGPAALIEKWEAESGGVLEESSGFEHRFTFAFDEKSQSFAMVEYTEGESDHRLYLFDKEGDFTGFYGVADDGTREWYEAFNGELGSSNE